MSPESNKRSADAFSGSRILVVGGTGFIGTALVARLLTHSPAAIVVVGRRPAAEVISLPSVEYRQINLAIGGFDSSLAEDFHYVFNCAAVIDQSIGHDIYRRQFASNLEPLLGLLAQVRRPSLRCFVQVGSNAEYGLAEVPQDANGPCAPNSAYGVSKLAASQLVLALTRSEAFPAVVARPFLVYGEGLAPGTFLSAALRAARAGEEFPTTSGEQTRDFVSLGRVIDGMLEVAADSRWRGGTANLCTGVERSLRSVLEQMMSMAPGFRPRFGAVPLRSAELMRSCGTPFRPVSRGEADGELMTYLRKQLHA